jgi:AbrB family looped-hinge helix DNA binding protein
LSTFSSKQPIHVGKYLTAGNSLLVGKMLMMAEVLRSDDRGRITIPRWARDKLGYKYGEPLELRVEDRCLILSPPTDEAGKKLDVLLGEVKFDRSARRRAERWLKDQST